MGLREKVALIITVIILIQAIYVTGTPERKTIKDDNSKTNQKRSLDVASQPLAMKTKYPHVQRLKAKRKQLSEASQEVFRKVFNFPDIEYPIASTPRPPYYLQESNILQRNLVPQTSPLTLTDPSSTFSTDSKPKNMKNKNKKLKNLAKLKTPNKPEITNSLSDFGTSAKQYYKEALFPEIEYPLVPMESWKPNYWQEMSSYGQKKNDINKLPNCPVDTVAKLSSRLLKKKSRTSFAAPKFSTKKTKNGTKSLVSDTTESPVPLTPNTISYFETTLTDKKIDENEGCICIAAPPKKSRKKKDKKKKNPNTPFKNDTSKEDCGVCVTKTPSHSVTSVLQENTKTQDNLVTLKSEEPSDNRNLGESDTCPNVPNQNILSIYVATTTPPYVSSNDIPSISPSKIRNDDKMPSVSCDNKVGSLSDAINAAFENTDNKDSCFEDNVINSNKSLAFDADEEFTTDVFPDFDENMLSVSTSTMSPMTLDIDEAWANSVIIDPYKSVAYPDELEQYYIALP